MVIVPISFFPITLLTKLNFLCSNLFTFLVFSSHNFGTHFWGAATKNRNTRDVCKLSPCKSACATVIRESNDFRGILFICSHSVICCPGGAKDPNDAARAQTNNMPDNCYFEMMNLSVMMWKKSMKKIRVLLKGVEPKSFRALFRMLYHWATWGSCLLGHFLNVIFIIITINKQGEIMLTVGVLTMKKHPSAMGPIRLAACCQ